MKRIKLTIAALAVISAVAPSMAGEMGNVDVRNCTWCHGPSAQGYAPAPRLAGQRYRYIFNQLKSYNAHARDNPFSRLYMWPATANLGPGAAHYLAVYLSSLPPKAADDGNPALVAMGRAIYQGGVPDSNVAACAVCHGPRAQGVGGIPRLGGLSFSYLQARLGQWREGFDGGARHPMPHVASQLSSPEIAALASYLSFLK